MSSIRIITIGGEYLVDNSLIEAIARAAHVDCETALWHGGYEGVAATTAAGFDADAMAALAHRVIEEAASQGIVGRGGQCIPQDRRDAFHVFIYAPRRERIEHILREQGPVADAEQLMDDWDRRREAYTHLYDPMLCSSMGETAAVGS